MWSTLKRAQIVKNKGNTTKYRNIMHKKTARERKSFVCPSSSEDIANGCLFIALVLSPFLRLSSVINVVFTLPHWGKLLLYLFTF